MTDVAIVHDYLTQRGGAERTVLQLAEAFPDAPIHTSLFWREGTFPRFDSERVQSTLLNRVAAFRQDHRRALPLLAPAFSRMRVSADVVVCSSSGWAHGAATDGQKIVYCYTPARWLYQTRRYTSGLDWTSRIGLRAIRPLLRRWDQSKAHSADRYLVISSAVRKRVDAVYGIDAEVVPPPLTLDATAAQSPVDGVAPGSWLAVARLLPYKNVDVIVKAFRDLPHRRLIVVGDGPEAPYLRSIAPQNVTLLGTVTDPELRWLYAKCSGTVAASYEDFGLTPLEAAAFGKPTVAVRFGGYLDTIIPGETGLLVDKPTPDLVRHGVVRASHRDFSRERLMEQAQRFDAENFRRRVRKVVKEVATG